MNKNSSWETSVKPVVVLSVIALIVSLLLAMVNSFTAPIIEENPEGRNAGCLCGRDAHRFQRLRSGGT